jgi:hypothetical protein
LKIDLQGSVNMGRLLSLVIISAITFTTLPHGFVRAQYRESQSARQSSLREEKLGRIFKNYESLRLDAARARERVRREGRLQLATGNGTLNLRLVPNDMRAPNYRAVSMTADGEERELPMSPVITYRGTVEGMPGAEARFTLDSNQVEGLILTSQERFYLEPMQRYDPQAGRDDYILYRASDIKEAEASRSPATLTLNHKVDRARQLAASRSSASFMPQTTTSLRQVELATEADNEFVNRMGGATAANSEIQNIINQVDAIYQREVGLTFKIVFQSAWDTTDPYTATDLVGMVNEFANYWNTFRTNVQRDLAHMWTGKETGGIGVSFQGTVCLSPKFSYGVSPFVVKDELNIPQRTALTAHEIGHSFNATHSDSDPACANTIMNTVAGPNTQLTFCQRSRNEITSFVNANSQCLTVIIPPPQTGPASLGLTSSNYFINENDASGVATVTVTRTGDPAPVVSVDFVTSDVSGLTPCQNNGNGAASERCDYATQVGTLRFAAGETTKTIQIPIINDAYVETSETFNITLRNPQGASLTALTTATVTINSEDTQTATSNPIDNQGFFIRQQYIDFLGRVAEPSGFDFWNNRMNNCPAGQVCDRIDTSMRFFQSDEFQERGFYVYRLYDAVLGRLPLYAEFVPDVARLNGQQTVAEQRQSKDAYLQDFVNRQEFRNLYGQFLSADASQATNPTGFVDALIARAGITPANRQILINNLQSGARTPAQTLEDFILAPELSNVGTKFYDRGFITMQYFGYLRRNPDQAGFNFWVGQLIGANAPHRGDYRFMVGGFLNSDEYRFRFAMISSTP